jgi:hypothetical protein
MKKKGLGLRERNQVSADDLNKAIQDQQGKLVHLGELMLQRGIVSKVNLVSALAEVARIQHVDCTLVHEAVVTPVPNISTSGNVYQCRAHISGRRSAESAFSPGTDWCGSPNAWRSPLLPARRRIRRHS